VSGHVIISHGLESSPDATKATALSQVAEALGWTQQRPDYRRWDGDVSRSRLGDIEGRIAHLQQLAAGIDGPLLLAGSSMGAFVSARVSLVVPVIGLFLMAPPTQLEGFEVRMDAARVPTRIVHGWDDELIPAEAVMQWARARRDTTVFVDDGHRLADHVEFCAGEFGRLLQSLS
jgi:predicted alpha/beta-hydrolase family hydrolase